MSEEDVKLLQAIRDWRPPTTLHPIAMRAWYIYDEHNKSLSAEAIAKIKALLDSYGDDLKGLAEALEGLTRFLLLLTEQYKDQAGGEKVAELMRSYAHLYEPFWERVGEALQNVSSDTKSSFQQFLDREQVGEKTAPAFGEAPPKNTVPLRNLAPPPGRPPPWAKKGTPK